MKYDVQVTHATGFAPGKIILSGDHAVVHGYPGIAVPVERGIAVTFEGVGGRASGVGSSDSDVHIAWNEIDTQPEWQAYLQAIVDLCQQHTGPLQGTLTVDNQLPLGKGMGSSTALTIATARCWLGDDCKEAALAIEDTVNPGHSGLDFSVIWTGKPVLFRKGSEPETIDLPHDLLSDAVLIDTGSPEETTTEMIAYVQEQLPEVQGALETIGHCTQRLADGEDLVTIMKDHYQAQITLGIVPPAVQDLIAQIEASGGAAKVIGAGGRAAGAGMILALNVKQATQAARSCNVDIVQL